MVVKEAVLKALRGIEKIAIYDVHPNGETVYEFPYETVYGETGRDTHKGQLSTEDNTTLEYAVAHINYDDKVSIKLYEDIMINIICNSFWANGNIK